MAVHNAAMSSPFTTRAVSLSLRAGVLWGLGVGVVVWALYFVQASVLDLYFWDVTVVPILVSVALVAGGVAVARPLLRRFCVGLALGAITVLPLALAGAVLLFGVLHLE
jgi:hypothetical protein